MRAHFYILFGLVGLMLAATQGQTQYPGGDSSGRRSGKSGWSGMSSMDPNQFFDRMANGKEVWIRAEITSGFGQSMFDRMAATLGVTNGQITRQQFAAYIEQRRAEGGGRPPSAPTAPGSPPTPGGSPAPAAPGGPDMIDQYAESSFRRHDLNGDGLLNYDEMSQTLRAERETWDTNRDGFIDLNEYKAYYRARMAQRSSERGGSFGQAPPPEWGLPSGIVTPPPSEEEESRPTVYRAGKLPKELPAWFKQLDTDEDGQIGLYEWKSSGRSLEEFEAIDRNNDGFLTVEEVLHYEAKNKDRLAKAPPGSSSGGPPRMGSFGGPPSGFGGPGGSSDGRGSGFRGSRGSRGGSR